MSIRLNKGLSLVEVMVASAVILMAVAGLVSAHNLYLKAASANSKAVKAAYLAEEALEAMRFLRDESWSENIESLQVDVRYGVVFSGGEWQLSTTELMVDEFERTVTLGAVRRNVNRDISSSGGSLDENARLVVSTVSWQNRGATTTRTVSTYLTDLYGN